MKKIIFIWLFLLPIFSLAQNELPTSLKEAIKKADPENVFSEMIFHMRIQEPRVGNPERFSNVFLNKGTGAFRLERNREDKIAAYIIKEDGTNEVTLDGCQKFTEVEAKTYWLDPKINYRYKEYYKYLFGLPIILNDAERFKFISSEETSWKGQEAITYTFNLTTPIFSPQWKLTFTKEDHVLQRLDFYDPENPEEGEYLLFYGKHQVGSITIPRMKHWYDKKNDEYLGSDIIVHDLPAEKK
jgi:hypothetical protein